MPLVKSHTESYTTSSGPPLAVLAGHTAIDTAPAALQHPLGDRTLQVQAHVSRGGPITVPLPSPTLPAAVTDDA